MTAPTINHNRDYIYLLVDEVTDGILHVTDDLTAGTAMTLFSPRIKIIPLETHKPFLRKEILDVDYQDTTKHLIWKNGKGMRWALPMPEIDITPEYIAFREEVKLRTFYHELLLIRVQESSFTNTTETPLLEQFASTIVDDLLRSNPNVNYFTPGICAYADACGIDDLTAYRELQLHMDNLKTTRMYVLGTYIKYRNMLNNALANRKEQMAVIDQLITNVYKRQL
jgi:hypothetical protein